jgi:magnesium chelatase family protein
MMGVLFLDEPPEFNRGALEALRQPLETGRVSVARANGHVTFRARVQLIAAMNPFRCGYLAEPGRACGRASRCAQEYQSKLSGPLLDRIDLHIDVPAVAASDLALPPPAESSADIAERVLIARKRQTARYAALPAERRIHTNAEPMARCSTRSRPRRRPAARCSPAPPSGCACRRGYHRVLRVARTLADLDGAAIVARRHVAEALSYRRVFDLPDGA